MDGLALLCNLHADGPRSLRRLRQAGITTFVDLQRTEVRVIESLLESSRLAALRFKEEARGLEVRLEGQPLDLQYLGAREPALGSAADPPCPGPLASAGRRAPPVDTNRREVPTRDRCAGPSDADMSRFARALQIRKDVVDGLDAKTCELLVHEGIRTYGSLMDHAGLSLARRLGLSLPKLFDLGYRVKRMLRERLAEQSAAVPARVVARIAGEQSLVPVAAERVVELAPQPRRLPVRSFRTEPVFEHRETLEHDAPECGAEDHPPAPLHEDPGVAGPFV